MMESVAFTRRNRLGMKFYFFKESKTQTKITYEQKSIIVNVPIDAFMECWHVWQVNGGAVIQVAFPMLNASQREFLMTGITNSEWDEMMGPEE